MAERLTAKCSSGGASVDRLKSSCSERDFGVSKVEGILDPLGVFSVRDRGFAAEGLLWLVLVVSRGCDEGFRDGVSFDLFGEDICLGDRISEKGGVCIEGISLKQTAFGAKGSR